MEAMARVEDVLEQARRSVYPNESRNNNRAILGVSILRAPAGNATEPNSDRENV